MASGSLTAPNKTRDELDHTRFINSTKALRGLPPSYVPGSHLDPLADSQLPNNGTLMWNKNVEESNVSQFTYNSVNTPNENGDGAEKPVSKAKFRYIKFARFVIASVFIAVTVVVIAAVTIMYQKAPGPDPKAEDYSKEFQCFLSSDNTTTTHWKLRFNTAIVILCNYSENIEQIISNSSLLLEFNPNIYRLQAQHFPEINQTLQSETISAGRWIIRSSPIIEIRGGPVNCGDEGQLVITLQTPIRSYKHQVDVQIESELSSVRMEVGQSAVDKQFEIRCSSTSGCTPASINLIGTLRNTTFPLYGMNFTCITTYNGDDGWSVGCTGSIPESVVSSIDEITCRPVLQNQTEAGEAEVKISKEVLVCNDSLNCSFDCSGDNQDKYYSNPKFCNIFHRCVDKRLYTAPCGKGAYFSTQTCVCSNIDDVIKEIGCDKDGMRLNVENVKTLCMYSTGS
ncbi:uncharacterized protein [Magallana gigas]|uniref:uncharacterized protein isoform X1 n=1 Tax=Magallana gigas TaxID=29159 RepID=UPI00334141E8